MHQTPEQTIVNGHIENGVGTNGQSTPRPPTRPPQEPVAIVGMSCKFAGDASNPERLWDLMLKGKDCWSTIPQSRYDSAAFYHPNQQRVDKHHTKGGYFLNSDPWAFDAQFFSLTAEAASAMDPQLRLLMEGVYEAIEDAGITLEDLAGSNTSVFSASFAKDYADILMKDPSNLPPSFVTGNGTAMYSNRISHFYDLQGPSVTMDAGCSGSQVALHLGVQSLQRGESERALIAASTLMLNPDFHISLSGIGVVGSEGRCYSWDERWGGYGRGEGTVVLLLKPLSHAIRDGDFVHSVIRQTAANQDGKTATLTSPSMEAQRRLIEECYSRAGLDMSRTGYVEAHMTGTSGDSIEAEAIARTLGRSRAPGDPVLVGSVKTNVGHTEPVSGLASVVKTALALRYGVIPHNLNYEIPSSLIPLKEWNVCVPTAPTPWPADKPFASVNNFGYGGTNVHLIMEAAPQSQQDINGSYNQNMDKIGDSSLVYVVSSKDRDGALAMSRNLAAYIRTGLVDGQAASLAYTLSERRSRLRWTTAVKARSLSELADRLEDKHLKPFKAPQKTPRLGFVFNGQGAQWHAMGRELFLGYPVMEKSMRLADKIMRDEFGAPWSLVEELFRDKASSRVHGTDVAQPISVALQLCLVDLLASWDVHPAAVVSHSSGEIAAAYAAGILSFKQALGVVFHRGRLAKKHQKLASLSGGMLAVGTSSEEAEEYIANVTTGKVVVACVNSPTSVTLSGDLDALDEVAVHLAADDVFVRKLQVPMAYHSHHMMHMAAEYGSSLESILKASSGKANIPFASPVSGKMVTPESASFGPDHWVQNLTSPVLFSAAFSSMQNSTELDMIVEIGAHDQLAGPVRHMMKDRALPYLSCLRRPLNAVDTMHQAVCDLVVQGYPVRLSRVNQIDVNSARYVQGLPSYAWNHTSRYTAEPRASREHRHKRFPPHELLGSIVAGGNKATPTWRNHIRVEDMPWLDEHQVDSQVVLPGAAYVSMAIEAVRLSQLPNTPGGYRLRDVQIINGLVIPDSSTAVETLFSLRPSSDKDLDSRDWYEFDLHSVSGDDAWTKHCSGYVLAEDAGKSTMASTSGQPSDFLATAGEPERDIDTEETFRTMRESGFYYGPSFQNIVGGRTAGSKSVTEFTVSPAASEAGDQYVLHPTTLDTVFQACYVGLSHSVTDGCLLLPRAIKHLSVPHATPGMQAIDQDVQKAFMEQTKSSERQITFEGTVFEDTNASNSKSLFIEGFQLQRIRQTTDSDETADSAPRTNARLTWELDVLHDIPESIRNGMKIQLSDNDLRFEQTMRDAARYFISEACIELAEDDINAWEVHHRKFFHWMTSIVRQDKAKAGRLGQDNSAIHSTLASLEAQHVAGELLCKLGKQLANIVRGRVQPLQIMLEGDMLHRYYQELPRLKDRSFKHLQRIMDLYAVEQPGAKILEIGGGTGSSTTSVLSSFSKGMGTKDFEYSFGHYDFTDVSTGFFPAAKEKFAAWSRDMSFSKLDIENDPETQGFMPGSYDLIVAAHILHATKDLSRTLTNIRKLMKPNGKMVLLENTRDSIDSDLIFGTLPGWWLSEEPMRQMSPNVDIKTWDMLLRAAEFAGVDFQIEDCEDTDIRASGLIVTTAAGTQDFPVAVTLIRDVDTPKTWSLNLADKLEETTGHAPDIEMFNNLQEIEADRVYIVTVDMLSPLLDKLNSDSFETLKSLLLRSRGVLWVSCGGIAEASHPRWAQTVGLLRTVRREDLNRRIVHVDLEASSDFPWTPAAIKHIANVFRKTFDYAIPTSTGLDWEYGVKNLALHVPRIYQDREQDKACYPAKSTLELRSFYQPDKVQSWEVGKEGLCDVPQFAEAALQDGDLPEGMIEISPKAFGLNCTELLTAGGMTKQSGLEGHEASGVIAKLGPNTQKSGLAVGDRVCGLFHGHIASLSQAHWTSVAKVPDHMSWEEAASIPYAYTTAYIALQEIARLRRDECILIHSASGDVGQATLMMAQHLGAKDIYVTSGSEAKKKLLNERYGIPLDHMFSNANTSFGRSIMALSYGRGVDVVLNSLEGPMLKATWSCMAPLGRLIHTGPMFDIEAARQLDISVFARGTTFAALDPFQHSRHHGQSFQQALKESISLWSFGRVKSLHPILSFPLGDLAKAVKHRATAEYIGKNVVVPRPDEEVQVMTQTRPVCLDQAGATYLVVGGVGGVGSAIAEWMMEKGARSLLIVSRNASSHADVRRLSEAARSHGCQVHFRNCDITEEADFLRLLKEVSDLPPIRGVVQGAMVLSSALVERMSYEQWVRAIRPKVEGTMNLHKHLPDLAFFIMLSSITGVVGSVSQANYTAGNTFQDTLARHRVAHGLPATVIDLGLITDIRWGAEEDALRGRLEKALKATAMSRDHTIRLIESAIRNPIATHPDNCQVICYGSQHQDFAEDQGVQDDKRFGPLRMALMHGLESSDEAGGASRIETLLFELTMAAGKPDSSTQVSELAIQILVARVSQDFNIETSEIDPALPLTSLGVDSLVAVQFRNWLNGTLKAKLSIFEILQSPSLAELASLVVERSALVGSTNAS